MQDVVLDDPSNSRRAGVTDAGRARTASVTSPSLAWAAAQGNSYDVTTDVLTIASAAETPLLWIRNEAAALHLRPARISFSFGRAYGTTETDVVIRVYDASEVIFGTSQENAHVANRDVGNRKPAPLLAKRSPIGGGGSGLDFSPAVLVTPVMLQSAARHEFASELTLARSAALLFTVQAPSGVSSMKAVCYVVAEFFDVAAI